MNGGGFGPRAEVQITRQTDETRRKISIRTAYSWALNENLKTLVVYFVGWCYWWFILMHLNVPRLSGWKTTVFVATTWGRTMAWSWPLWLIIPACQWIRPLYTLNRHNLKPKVMNDEWPMTHAPLDPNVVGAVGAEALNAIIARGGIPIADTSVPAREELNVRIEDRTGDPEQPDLAMCLLFSPAGHPGMLARYAAALVRTDGSRAAFSHAGGKHINGARFYMYTPDEFEELEIEAVRAGLVERERSNQPYKLTDRGRFTFARVAEKQLSSASLAPLDGPS